MNRQESPTPHKNKRGFVKPLIWTFAGTAASISFGLGVTILMLSGKPHVGGDFFSGLLTFDSLVLAVLALTFPDDLARVEVSSHLMMWVTFIPFVTSAILSLYSLLSLDTSGSLYLIATIPKLAFWAFFGTFWGLASWAFVSLSTLALTDVPDTDS
jgi:hypothetical protein